MPDTTYSANGHAETATRTHVDAGGGHTLTVDVPEDFGGTDDGPSPVDFVLAGLIGCLNLTGHIVADELGIEIDSLDIEAAGPINLARLASGDDADRAGLKSLNVTLAVDAPGASEQALTEWQEAVEDRCPVSDIVAGTVPLSVSVSTAASASV